MAYRQPKFEISKQVSGIKASPGKFLGLIGAAKLGGRLLDKVKGKDKKAEEASGSASGDHHHDHDHAGAASKSEEVQANKAQDGTKDMPLKKADPRRTIGKGKNFNKANKTGTGAAAGGGMTEKGVKEYKRNNPGSKLQTAVTKDPSKLKKGSKDAGRRKSFCARSKGWKGERGLAARRRWNC